MTPFTEPDSSLERLTLANMAIWAEDVDFRALAAKGLPHESA